METEDPGRTWPSRLATRFPGARTEAVSQLFFWKVRADAGLCQAAGSVPGPPAAAARAGPATQDQPPDHFPAGVCNPHRTSLLRESRAPATETGRFRHKHQSFGPIAGAPRAIVRHRHREEGPRILGGPGRLATIGSKHLEGRQTPAGGTRQRTSAASTLKKDIGPCLVWIGSSIACVIWVRLS